MLELDWNLLKRFKIAIEAGSVKYAMQKLNLSQASIYNIFTELEHKFKEEIIKKYNSGILEPSDFGNTLLNIVNEHNNKLCSLDNRAFINLKNEISIAAPPSVSAFFLSFLVNKIIENLNLTKLYLKTNSINLNHILLTNDLFIFEDLNPTKTIMKEKLGYINYALFVSEKHYEEISKCIVNKKPVKVASMLDSNFYFSSIDVFIDKTIQTLTGHKPNIIIDTDSSINEAIVCYTAKCIACLHEKSPLIKILNLQKISKEKNRIPIFGYYKKENYNKVRKLLTLIKNEL